MSTNIAKRRERNTFSRSAFGSDTLVRKEGKSRWEGSQAGGQWDPLKLLWYVAHSQDHFESAATSRKGKVGVLLRKHSTADPEPYTAISRNGV